MEEVFDKASLVMAEQPWYRKNILKWASYDLGNTIFSMAVVSLTITNLLYIMYYEKNGGDAEKAVNDGNASIALILLIGNLMMAVISPFLGAYSDQLPRRKGLLMRVSIFCILLMALLGVSILDVPIPVILIIFLFANLFYQGGLVIYDAMLPFITDSDKIGKVGGIGIALGYFGSFIAIGLGFALIPFFGDYCAQPADVEAGILNDCFTLGYIPYLYPVSALMFFLFAIPMFSVIEKQKKIERKSRRTLISDVSSDVMTTGREVLNYRDARNFILSWLIYVDAANTVILFMSPMVQVGLGFDSSTVLIVLAIGIFSAVLFTYPVGIFVDKYGPSKGLHLVTGLWAIAIIIGVFTNLHTRGFDTPSWPVYVFPWIVGPGLGGTWVIQRQYITELSPPEKVGNYFGFANIFGRISAAIGPGVWAISVRILNNMGFSISEATRFGMLVILAIMGLGYLFIVFGVANPHEAYLAGAKATGDGRWIDKDGNILFVSTTNAVENDKSI